jgi:hypothetical protein
MTRITIIVLYFMRTTPPLVVGGGGGLPRSSPSPVWFGVPGQHQQAGMTLDPGGEAAASLLSPPAMAGGENAKMQKNVDEATSSNYYYHCVIHLTIHVLLNLIRPVPGALTHFRK